jgi:hypothetical protein
MSFRARRALAGQRETDIDGENGQIELYGLTVDLNQYKGLNRTFDQSAVLDTEGIRGVSALQTKKPFGY